MAVLYFRVNADYEAVIRLRDEIKKLENQLKSIGRSTPEQEVRKLETQLASTKQQMMGLVTEAAKAGVVMGNDLKRKIDSVTKASDKLSEEIIEQRKIIRDTRDDIKILTDQYSKMDKYSSRGIATFAQLKRAKAALVEQRYSLGELQDQQARNRLELRKLNREYKEFTKNTGSATSGMDLLSSSLQRTVAEIGGLMAIRQFTAGVIDATGKMQQLQVALSTILQDEGKAAALIQEITQFAAKTPFNLDDVAAGAKQLLAYGSTAENVVDELSMLGDVANGLQIPIGQLIYLYGTLRTQGRAMTVDIRQFAGRGIPIYEELAKVLGVAKDQVGELVTAGKVGFKEVEQAFRNMTSEGGKFNDLMENSAGTWPQRISNIQDTLFQKLNDFGNKYKEVFEAGIGAAEELVENLDDVIAVIGGVVAAYGVYRAALISVAAAQKAQAFIENIRLIAMLRKELGLATAAQQAFNLASKANVYAAVLSAVVALGAAVYMLAKRTDAATEAQEKYQEQLQKTAEAEDERKRRMEELCSIAGDESLATDTRREALNKLEQKYPDIFAKYDTEYDKLKNIKQIKEEIARLDAENSITNPEVELRQVQDHLSRLYKGRGTARADIAEPQIKMLEQREKELMKLIRENDINEYFDNLGGVSDETIERLIRQRENLIARMTTGNKDFGRISKGDERLRGDFSRDELQYQLNKLRGEQERRKMNTGSSAEWVEQLRKAAEEAQKAYDDFISNTSNSMNEQQFEEEAKKLKDAAQAAKKMYDKYKPSLAGNDAGQQADKRLEAERRLGEELVELRRRNDQAEIEAGQEGLQKKLAQIALDYKERKTEIDQQEAEWKEENKTTGIAGLGENGLTAEQAAELARARAAADKQADNAITEAYQTETDAMNRYLADYGTFLEQRQAITEQYNERIAAATTEGERLSLQKEMEKALSSLDLEKLKQSINWGLIFSDLSKVSKENLDKVKKQLGEFKDSDEYKSMTVDQKQVVDEALDKINTVLIDKGGLLGDLPHQLNLLWEAQEELTKAQEEYNKAMKNGTDAEKEQAQGKLNAAQNKLNVQQGNVNKATDKTVRNFTVLSDAITQLGSSSELSLSQIGGLAEGIVNIFTQSGSKIGGIIGTAMSLLDVIGKQGLDGFIGNVFDNVFNGIHGVLDGLLGWTGIDFGGESIPNLADRMENLTQSNEDLNTAIDNLAKKMEEASVAEAPELYEQQKRNIEQMMANTQQQMFDSGRAYSNGFLGFIGGEHSSNTKINDSMNTSDWAAISKIVGRTIDSATDFWGLTSEEMYNVATQATTVYSKLKSLADDGHANAAQYMDEYTQYWKQLEELENAYREKLTSTSFDSIKDDFRSALLDMENSAETFADNFEEMMKKAMLESMMTELYDGRLQDWYEDFAGFMEHYDEMAEAERQKRQEELRQQYDSIVADAQRDWQLQQDTMGWDSDKEQQSASRGGFETMSQDQASELSGRFTAVAETGIRIEGAITELKGDLSGLLAQSQGIYNIANDTRNILAQSYLELQQINENTAAIIVPIQKMQKDIEQVKQNTARL